MKIPSDYLTDLEIGSVGEDERGWYAVLILPGILDGNFADVYGEDEAEARANAEAVIECAKLAFDEGDE